MPYLKVYATPSNKGVSQGNTGALFHLNLEISTKRIRGKNTLYELYLENIQNVIKK